jgi:virulence factor Mce-like protein
MLVGTVVMLTGMAAVTFSYYANTGLPFVPQYRVTVEMPSVEGLDAGAQVRVGGVRVGVVKSVQAQVGVGGGHAYGTANLAIEPKLGPLPINSTVTLTPQSVLGGQYIALTIGNSHRRLRPGQPLPLTQGVPVVQITDALRIFDKPTRQALVGTIDGYSDGFAGRGSALNDTITSFAHLIRPLGSVATLLAQPSTNIARFIRSGARLNGALVPVRFDLGPLFQELAPTLAALRGRDHALKRTIATGPATEQAVVSDFGAALPVLRDTTTLLTSAHAGTRQLAALSRQVAATFVRTRPSLRSTPGYAARLRTSLGQLDRVAQSPAVAAGLRALTAALTTLEPTLRFVLPAQTTCNVLGTFLRNNGSDNSVGDSVGAWGVAAYFTNAQDKQAAAPDPDLHFDPYPVENATECAAGNEPFRVGQAFGSPPGKLPATTAHTYPPAEATRRAAAAGLLKPIPGAAG